MSRIILSKPALIGTIISLHILFVVSSYNADVLSKLSFFSDPVVVHRMLMLLQLAPLVIVLSIKKLSKNRDLLFITFAVAASTVFIVDDFASGFYGALMDYESGIIPRMRASAALMAYRDTGRIVVMDPHQSFFLEFMTVHFLSMVTGLNYILDYFLVVRFIIIALWGLLFVLSINYFKVSASYSLFVAAAFLSANQGYNYEYSFAPIILVTMFLLLIRRKGRGGIILTVLMTVALVYASFRETLCLMVIGIITLIWLLLQGIQRNFSFVRASLVDRSLYPALTLVVVITLSRILDYSVTYYFEGYTNFFIELLRAVLKAASTNLAVEKVPLETIGLMRDPVDRIIGMFSAVSMISLLTILAIFSVLILLKRRVDEPLRGSVLLAFVLFYAVPVVQYIINLVFGTGFDFASSTTPARSLAPLAALAVVYTFPNVYKGRNMRIKRFIRIVSTIFLVFITIFVPFTFMGRSEVKSLYDVMLRASSATDMVIQGNALYHFVLTYKENYSTLYLDSTSRFLQLYYLLPLKYVTDNHVYPGHSPMHPSVVYSNGEFSATLYKEGVLLR